MKVIASITNSLNVNDIHLSTNGDEKKLVVSSKESGFGSSVNGGELLFLSLATCYCNDVYREAAKRKLSIEEVDVTVEGRFGSEGEPASDVTYQVHIKSNAPSAEIDDLIQQVDKLAEVHNTLRRGIEVRLVKD